MDAALDAVVARYERFAREEAPGRSVVYAAWAAAVCADAALAGVLARIPETRRQPPLVFAVTRLLGAPETDADAWAAWVLAHADDVVTETSRRSLQTNEPQRCAALLPALSLVEGPIALIELGASAGLCLYPDRYSYRYRGRPQLDPAGGESRVILDCDLVGDPQLRMPEIVWRAGVDLAPLNPGDPEDSRFLTTLVWPGEDGRASRIRAALEIAASAPPRLIAADATEPATLERLIDEAPAGARIVVTTPGVLPHIPRAGRDRLIAALGDLDVTWITIDPPALHDAWNPPIEAAQWGGFVLGVDGEPVAAVDPLGARVEWRRGKTASRS